MKRYRKILVLISLVFGILLLALVERQLAGQLGSQQLAKRWSTEKPFAQITCFFSQNAGITESRLYPVREELRAKLSEAAVDVSGKEGRSLVDAYSIEASVEISSQRSRMSVRAYGVSEDFFLFHPMKLLSGSYISAEDFNGDGVVIDELVAWQLFGSNIVTGKRVEIGDATYLVRGVVRSDDGIFSEVSEEGLASVYLAFPIAEKNWGKDEEELSINSYEVLIADPVTEFGVTAVGEALGLEDMQYELVENSTRFDLKHRLMRLKNFGARSMSRKSIIYPYWENRARGYEDISTLLLVFEILLGIYPAFCLGQLLYYLWRKREQIKQYLIRACRWIGKKAASFAKWFFPRAWSGIKWFFGKIWDGLKWFFPRAWIFLKEFFPRAWVFLKEFFPKARVFLKEFFPKAWTALKGFFPKAWAALKGFFPKAWAGIKGLPESVRTKWKNRKNKKKE